MWILWPNEMRKIWPFIFIPTWGVFTFFIHICILLIKNSRTIRYSVTTIWVFEYYSEITNGPNTNSTIRSQLFEYQIIRIIRCNSDSLTLASSSNNTIWWFTRVLRLLCLIGMVDFFKILMQLFSCFLYYAQHTDLLLLNTCYLKWCYFQYQMLNDVDIIL